MKTTSLAAILFAELAGFNDLLSRNEARAISLLTSYRNIIDPLIEEHGGELVDATGDEVLIVFGSAVGAVQCALHLRLSERVLTASLPPHERLSPRQGIHLGEIWRDEKRVYGNGVNLAARVKAEAGPGQILISEDVYRQVANKLDLMMRPLSDRPLKNIERPLAIYEILEGSPDEEKTEEIRPVASGTMAERPVSPPAPPAAPEPAEDAKPVTWIPVTHGQARPADEDFLEIKEIARAALGRALAKEFQSRPSEKEDRPLELEEEAIPPKQATMAGGRAKVIIHDGEDGEGYGLTIDIGDEEDKNAAPKTREVGPGSYERRMAEARGEMSKGFKNFFFAGLVGAGCIYFWSTTKSIWLLAGGALFGIGPALSGLKRLIKGAFDHRDAKQDLKRYREDHPSAFR